MIQSLIWYATSFMNRQRYVVVFADTTRRETTIFAAIINNNRITGSVPNMNHGDSENTKFDGVQHK